MVSKKRISRNIFRSLSSSCFVTAENDHAEIFNRSARKFLFPIYEIGEIQYVKTHVDVKYIQYSHFIRFAHVLRKSFPRKSQDSLSRNSEAENYSPETWLKYHGLHFCETLKMQIISPGNWFRNRGIRFAGATKIKIICSNNWFIIRGFHFVETARLKIMCPRNWFENQGPLFAEPRE